MYTVAMVVYIDSPLCTGSRSSPIGCVYTGPRPAETKDPTSLRVDEHFSLLLLIFPVSLSPSTSVSLSLWSSIYVLLFTFPFFFFFSFTKSPVTSYTHISKHIASGCIYTYTHTYTLASIHPPPLPPVSRLTSFFLVFPSAVGLYNPPLYTFPCCSTTRFLGRSS